MDEAREESKDDDDVVVVVVVVEDLDCLDPEVETEVVVLFVEADCERFRANMTAEVGEVVSAPALASCDVDVVAPGLNRRVGEARERIFVAEHGALQEGQQPSEDGPCSHYKMMLRQK